MKVVHLVTGNDGGAYRAALRINNALDGAIDSILISGKGISRSAVQQFRQWFLHKLFSYIPFRVRKMQYYFNTDLETMHILKLQQVKDADIIHLHWVADGMLNLTDLKEIAKLNKPVVWTLHDMHPFTGGCHYDNNCQKYKDYCGNCKQINSKRKKDFAWWNQQQKIKALHNIDISIVGCSRWITQCAESSQILKNMICITIPNCIDINVYKPTNKEWARNLFNINIENKKLIAFGAMDSTTDKRKGFSYLQKALSVLDKEKYACLILGGMGEVIDGIQTISIAYLHDDYSLTLFYSAADVFVAPSTQENLANTVMESLSCGTPVVAFDIGGMPDMIVSGYNGYLARPFEVEDMAKGIDYCCKKTEMRINAREYVVEKYGYDTVSNEYLKLYQKLLGDSCEKDNGI